MAIFALEYRTRQAETLAITSSVHWIVQTIARNALFIGALQKIILIFSSFPGIDWSNLDISRETGNIPLRSDRAVAFSSVIAAAASSTRTINSRFIFL